MKKFYALVVAMLACTAVTAVTSAAASAATCVASAKGVCIENLAGELVEEVLIGGAGLVNQKEAGTKNILISKNPAVSIECTTSAILELSGEQGIVIDETAAEGLLALSFIIDFSGCKVVGHANCTVANVSTLDIVGSSNGLEGTALDLNFSPEAGTTFAEVHITGCEQEAIIKVKVAAEKAIGQLCTLLEEETEKAVALIQCLQAGSVGLLVGGQEAKFETTQEVGLPQELKLREEFF